MERQGYDKHPYSSIFLCFYAYLLKIKFKNGIVEPSQKHI